MFRALIRSLRPRQWLKNGFILAAIVFDRQLTNPTALLHTLVGVVLFCLISSSVYLINDVMDLEADRNHPKKRLRPIASGQLPISMAIVTAIGFNVISLPASFYISRSFFIIALVYFVLTLAYSKWLKHIALIDVMVLAAGFVLRVAAGVSLIQVERFSPWLYVVTTLLALYILLGKRRAELSLLAKEANLHRPVLEGYTIPFLDQLIIIVSSTTIIAYSLYTFSAPNLPENHSMMLTIPFVLYGILRYLYLVQVKQEGGAPEDIVLADRPLQAAIGLWGLGVIVIFYLIPALG